jgi:DNA-binding GntR family transcriptional regulator
MPEAASRPSFASFCRYGRDVEFELPEQVRLPSASAAEQVVATLRRLIIEGHVPPGARLRESQLTAGFDVSRQTVREAIRTLAHDGLVRHDRHRGAVVVDLDGADVMDIYDVRRLLETAGVDRVPKASDERIANVERAYERLVAAATGGSWAGTVDADIAFHRSLTELAGNPRLVRAFEAVTGELAFCLSVLRLVGKEEQSPDPTISSHEPIAAAVVDRDSARARTLVQDHLDRYGAELAQALAGRRRAAVED